MLLWSTPSAEVSANTSFPVTPGHRLPYTWVKSGCACGQEPALYACPRWCVPAAGPAHATLVHASAGSCHTARSSIPASSRLRESDKPISRGFDAPTMMVSYGMLLVDRHALRKRTTPLSSTQSSRQAEP